MSERESSSISMAKFMWGRDERPYLERIDFNSGFDWDKLDDELSGMLPGAAHSYYIEAIREEAHSQHREAGIKFRHETSQWYQNHHSRARRYGGIDTLTRDQWYAVVEAFDRRCAYCDKPYPVRSLTVDHIEPMSQGGDHALWNVAPACRPCNSSKGANDIESWCTRTYRPLEPIETRLALARSKLHAAVGSRPLEPSLF
jgi:hypothetical protein